MEKKYNFFELKYQNIEHIPYISNMGLFGLMRSLESIFDLNPKLGDENKINQNKFRFGQSAYLSFHNKQIKEFVKSDKYLKININGFGLFGPNGPLPLHISEYTYGKKLHQKENTFNDFLDIFHNRLICLFYKAWRNAQDIVSLDGEDSWRFSRYVASTVGMADHQDYSSDVHLYNKLYYSGYLLNKNMPLSNLKSILSRYFNTVVNIKENIGQWIDAHDFSTCLSFQKDHVLGNGLLIGDKVFDATQKFRIIIGPLAPEQYLKFIQGHCFAKQLVIWVEQYCRYQYQWDVEIIVDRQKIVQQTLGQGLSLGFTSWVGEPKQDPMVIIQY